MAVYRVQGPDGKIHRFEGPDGAAPAEIEAAAAQQFGAKPAGKTWDEKVQFERGKLQEDLLKEMPWYEKARAGFGKAFTDSAQGISQFLGRTPTSEVDEERKLSSALMDDPAAIGGNLAGNVAKSVAIPGGSTLKGAALVNALLAGAEPVASGESRAFNTGLGGVLGAGGQGGARVLGKVISGPKNVLNEAERELATKAEAMGIPLSAGDKTGNRFLQVIESQMEKMPATSAAATEQRLAKGKAFTRVVTNQFGANADNVGEEVMSASKQRLGEVYDKIFSKTSVDLSPDVALPRLSQIVDDAITALPKEKSGVISRQIDAILGKVDEAGAIPGKAYQKWRSGVTSKDGDINHYLKQVKQVVDEAAQASLGQDSMAALKLANTQYKNLKTVQPLAAGSANGQVPAGQLLPKVRQANPNMAFDGGGEMGQVAKIGARFVKDQVPDSGTAQRAMAQMLLSGGMGAGAYGATGDAETALKAGVGSLAATTIAPKMVQALMGRPGVQQYLTQGGLLQGAKVDPRLIELLLKGSAGAPVGGWAALSQ